MRPVRPSWTVSVAAVGGVTVAGGAAVGAGLTPAWSGATGSRRSAEGRSLTGRSTHDRIGDPSYGGGVAYPRLRVLLADDGSRPSEIAGALVRSLSWPRGTEFRSVTVVAGSPVVTAAALYADMPIALGPAAFIPLPAGPRRMAMTFREGTVIDEVLEEAAAWQADILVMGGHQGPGVPSRLLEPLAAIVAEQAPCAVLVARTPRVDRVLLVEDGSESAARAAALIARIPGIGRREIAALTTAGDASLLGRVDRILGQAAERRTELIVLGAPLDPDTHDDGIVARAVLVDAPCSVLIVDRT